MTYIWTNAWNEPITPTMRLKKMTGDIIGTVTCQNLRKAPAPSMAAAS